MIEAQPLTGYSAALAAFDLIHAHGDGWVFFDPAADDAASLGRQCRDVIMEVIAEVSDKDPDSDWAEVLRPSVISAINWDEVGQLIIDHAAEGYWDQAYHNFYERF